MSMFTRICSKCGDIMSLIFYGESKTFKCTNPNCGFELNED